MDERSSYIEKIKAQLKAWDAEIETLQAKANVAKAEVKEEYVKVMNDIRVRKESAQTKLQGIQEAGQGSWEELKTGLEKSWDELKNAVEKARQKLKE